MKRALGKGLGALLTADVQEGDIRELKINDIEPSIEQPRREFDEEMLKQLADSIEAHGLIQPIVVRKEDSSYRIVAGERRWRAARIVGMEKIPAIVKEYSDNEMLEVALIENLQREDLNPLEEAEAFRKLIDVYGLTQEQISTVIGKSRSAIANSLRLNKLHEKIKDMLRENLISEGHARTLLSVEDMEKQAEVADAIVSRRLSVRDTESLVKKYGKKGKPGEKAESITEDMKIEIRDIENNLKDIMSTRVKIQSGRNSGKIVIEYYSNDELDRLLELFEKMK